MKLTKRNIQKSPASKQALVPVRARAQSDTDLILGRSNFDSKVQYVGSRIRTNSILVKSQGKDLSKCDHPGYLVVAGDKPGTIISKVQWDKQDVYCRDKLGGSLSALNAARLKAEILTDGELVKRAVQFNKVIEVEHVKTKELVRVALLNNFGELYVAGVSVTASGALKLYNMEPPAHYNKTDVQYVKPKDLTISAKKFLRVV